MSWRFWQTEEAKEDPKPLTPEQLERKIQRRHERKAKAERKRQRNAHYAG